MNFDELVSFILTMEIPVFQWEARVMLSNGVPIKNHYHTTFFQSQILKSVIKFNKM